MKIQKFSLFLFVFAISIFTSNLLSAQSFLIIVNEANPVDAIQKSEISKILLKKTTKWDNGETILPIDLEKKSKARSAFTKDVHGRSVSSIKDYWKRQVISGDGVPPPEVATDTDVLKFVMNNPGAIGYVSGSTPLIIGVKEIQMIVN